MSFIITHAFSRKIANNRQIPTDQATQCTPRLHRADLWEFLYRTVYGHMTRFSLILIVVSPLNTIFTAVANYPEPRTFQGGGWVNDTVGMAHS